MGNIGGLEIPNGLKFQAPRMSAYSPYLKESMSRWKILLYELQFGLFKYFLPLRVYHST